MCQGCRVRRVSLDFLVILDYLDQMDAQDFLDQQVRREILAFLGAQESLEVLDQKETLERWEFRVHLDRREHQDFLADQAPLASLDHQVFLGPKVNLVLLELVHLDQLDLRENLDSLASLGLQD